MLNKKLTALALFTFFFATSALHSMMPRDNIKKLHRELYKTYNMPFTNISERIRNLTKSNVLCSHLLVKHSNGLRKNSEKDSRIITALNQLKHDIRFELQNLKEY